MAGAMDTDVMVEMFLITRSTSPNSYFAILKNRTQRIVSADTSVILLLVNYKRTLPIKALITFSSNLISPSPQLLSMGLPPKLDKNWKVLMNARKFMIATLLDYNLIDYLNDFYFVIIYIEINNSKTLTVC